MNTKKLALVIAATLASFSYAGVTPDEVKKLGTTLTPWGAERSASKDGAIPAYDGGLTKPPVGFSIRSGKWPDPYPDEKPLFSINAENMGKYADKLTPGTQEMLKRYDTYRVDVYPSHRGYWMDKKSQDNTILNASNPACKVENNGETIVGCWAGIPFPIPKNGYEVMWNYQLRHMSDGYQWTQNWIVNASGNAIFILQGNVSVEYPYWNTKQEPYKGSGQYYKRYVSYIVSPSRDAGNINTTWQPLDYKNNDQKTWTYTTGQRRVRIAPEFSYDTPIATVGGALLYDEVGMFSGRMDRHDYKLVGKKEMLIPYNGYRYANAASPEAVLGPKHVNPDMSRWEMHRVWVVEATIKPGLRHVAAKRTFYIDEDTWGIVASEGYDASGKMYRVMYSNGAPNYAAGGYIDFNSGLQAYDLTKGHYLFMGFVGGSRKLGMFTDAPPIPPGDLTPEGMVAKGVR